MTQLKLSKGVLKVGFERFSFKKNVENKNIKRRDHKENVN
jgi:hypothetical protein